MNTASINHFRHLSAFSLIEVIVVILLLAVLSAMLVPRFINLRDDAEFSAVQSTAGVFRNAVQLVQLKFKALSPPTRVQNLPGFGAGNVDTNNLGFPIGITKGSVNENIGIGNAGCQGVWEGIMDTNYTASTGGSTDFQTYRHTDNKVCSYVWRKGGDTAGRNAASLVIQYDSRDGQVYFCGTHSKLNVCPF